MEQLRIEDAIAAGERGIAQSVDAATRRDPLFAEKARTAILRHLRACPGLQCSGEELVDVARAHGAVPPDDRAFGSVFQTLARKGLIRTVGYTVRRKGHGTAGGRVWALSQ